MGSNQLYGIMLRGVGFRLLLMAVLATGLLAGASSALAIVTGENDKIAFARYRFGGGLDIYVMKPDGSGETNLTASTADSVGGGTQPAWSPDGTKIAFASSRSGYQNIYTMHADGSNVTRLTSIAATESDPTWSPDGTKIAFVSRRDGNPEIYVMHADGSGQTRLTDSLTNDLQSYDVQPAWSPDGGKIAFASYRTGNPEIYVMNPDGSGQTRLTATDGISDSEPDWSPDGTKIVFTSGVDGNFEIYTMNADGTVQTRLTDSSGWDAQPAWSPDGTKITFASVRAGSAYQNIYTMNADGSEVTRLTDSSTHNWDPDWQFVAVGNTTPVVGPITASTDPVAVNTSVAASASFTDADAADTHTATWDWGDGTTSAGTVTESSGSGSVSGSHTYTAAGVYTVGLTVTDDDGGTDSETFQYVVVYDPEAGFVTGGGSINSPAGAYASDPTLSGKASFGFVSRYQKGATTPSGRTQFRFRAGNLDFDSTSYEWLVISGPKAQYKGSGTINGTGDYGFLLTANDGQVSGGGDVDRFRIKIWEKATDDVVYDNQMGDADDAAASTAIEGGSIVIHK